LAQTANTEIEAGGKAAALFRADTFQLKIVTPPAVDEDGKDSKIVTDPSPGESV
jgi:hypothetical protein